MDQIRVCEPRLIVRGKKEKASERQKKRDALGAQKTTLSKEGFKDYQLRLLGNLRSCILSTSKGRCVLEYCKWEWSGVGRGRAWTRGESDLSNKCWHQACLILDSGNSLICYRLWNSSDVLQRGRLATVLPPRANWESRDDRAGRTSGRLQSWPLRCYWPGVSLSESSLLSLEGCFLYTPWHITNSSIKLNKKHFRQLRSLITVGFVWLKGDRIDLFF